MRGNDISVFEVLFYRCEHDLLIRPFFPLCVGGSQIYDRCPTRFRPVKCINELARRVASAPVGYLTVLRMYPMDFEEFMVANNVSTTTLDMLEDKFKTVSPIEEFIHQKLLAMFFVYLIVGGMPDAVKTYIETKDIREVDRVQRDITTLYKEDFSQYELEDRKLKLKSIYDIIPAELNKQNK